MRANTFIGAAPPNDSREWECQCARCGSSMDFENCSDCCGGGETEPGELHEYDPLFYRMSDTRPCYGCGGTGGDWWCLSGADWCEANPLTGRENIPRGTVEWFTLEPARGEITP